jgi:FkbM family methyltransferase
MKNTAMEPRSWLSIIGIQLLRAMTPHDVKQLLQKENPLVLEIGANVGGDTAGFLQEFADIRIFCFEPDPRCIAAFKQQIHDSRCVLIEAAVSDRSGSAVLSMSSGAPPVVPQILRKFRVTKKIYSVLASYFHTSQGDWNASSSIVEARSHPKDVPWLIFNKQIEVPTISLDEWTQQQGIGEIDFVWADVQGAEKKVIEGAVDTLKRIRFFYTEYGATSSYPEALTRRETIDLITNHGFELVPEYSERRKIGNLLFRNLSLTKN